MTRGRFRFKQQFLVRALEGAKAAGIEVSRIEIEKDGKIVLSTPLAPAPPRNPYDAWKVEQDEG